jgi:hypothetical protein
VLRQLDILPENFALFSSPVRNTQAGIPNVMPDSVGVVGILNPAPDPPTDYINSALFEVKATKATITKSYRSWQITGMIDAAALSPLGAAAIPGKPPLLYLITTGDAKIGADLIAEATTRKVALFWAVVYEVPGTTPAQLIVSSFTLLNPTVGTPIPVFPPQLPSPLIQPVGQNAALDPDPPEIDDGL